MTCTICTDTYSKTRQQVSCAACNHEVCTRCVKAFLLTTPEPNCMNCRVPWNREFLDRYLPKSWREGPLKEHRAAFLFDRERSMLPATQPAVEIELTKRTYGEELPTMVEKWSGIKDELDAMQLEIDRRHYFIRHGRHPGSEPEKEKRKFIAACPAADCRGFLSTAYKCGTCQIQYCADCREQKSEGHICDPALVATIAAIVKDSKPCPRCGTAISKVSGCDQMYCTSCDTAYSYETGKVVTGVIHNPHYFERMKAGQVPRQPGDQACGPAMQWPAFLNLPVAIRSHDLARAFFRLARHVEQVTLPRYAAEVDNTDLRVRYLLKELDEEALKRALQQRDRKRQKDLEIRAPLELFVVTALEFFLDAPSIDKLPSFIAQIEKHVNVPLRSIGARYANKIPQIDLVTGEIIST